MKGFDDRFADFPDYILGITREIWEDRGLGARVKDYYHPDVILRRPAGIGFGDAAVTADTMAMLHDFPDRQLLGEDVIWSGTPEVGMLSSHRILSTGTHSQDGPFGPAMGRRVRFRALAECYAKANRISDEWLVRDTGAILRQLGCDVREWSRAQIADLDPETQPFRPAIDVQGPYSGQGNDDPWGEALGHILTQVMAGDFSVIPGQYDRAVQAEYPGGVTVHGTAGVDRFWLGLRSSFPSARFRIHHRIGLEEARMPPRAALRWSLTGRHDGWGSFGRPGGAEVHVMGISHAEFGPRGLRREWTLYDETAIWMQILAQSG